MRRLVLPMVFEGRRVLFVSYNGMLDPLGQSQVIPYLHELRKRGIFFTLLSFERAATLESEGRARCAELRDRLAADNIEWHWLRYHQKPSLPATIYDVLSGIRYAARLVRRNKIEMVHARSHIPATIALALKKRFPLKMIFDVRGLMAEEYVDAEHWRKSSIPYRLTKFLERRALAAADGVVTLTEKIWPIISEWPGLCGRQVAHQVVPCCTDLNLFKFSNEDRTRLRAELGLGSRFTLVYSGSIDGWYLTEKMADFFAYVLTQKPEAHFLWLTTGSHSRITDVMRTRAVASGSYTIRSVRPAGVAAYLSASDAGIAFIKPCFSKLASSPTKYAEYLACGLPLVVNAGIGDSDTLVTEEGAGVLVGEFNEAEYTRAVLSLQVHTENPDRTRSRSREIATRLFDVSKVGIDRYARLYERVFSEESRLPK